MVIHQERVGVFSANWISFLTSYVQRPFGEVRTSVLEIYIKFRVCKLSLLLLAVRPSSRIVVQLLRLHRAGSIHGDRCCGGPPGCVPCTSRPVMG
jgi:hypothetical protein